MKMFRNRKLRTRMAAGFACVLLLMAGIVAVAALRLAGIDASSRQMVDRDWIRADAAALANLEMRSTARYAMQMILDIPQVESMQKEIGISLDRAQEALQVLERLVSTEDGRELLARIGEERETYVAALADVPKFVLASQPERATGVLIYKALPALESLQSNLDRISQLQRDGFAASGAGIERDISSARAQMFSIGLAALLLGVLMAWWLTRSITRPLARAVEIARTVAAGDLRSEIEVHDADVRGGNETAQLLAALRDMNTSLERMVGQVRMSSESIATGASQIATGNADLSQRTEEQASNLQQTAASMEELTTTVQQNADTARQASELAATASESATLGGEVVARVVGTMQEITASSKRIEDIIGVIDGIAFQTNILALNAAVEAARAGEQGRGFAVVAGEVRSLAQRSADAAREIKTLIGASVEKVETGSQYAGDAGQRMREIVVEVRRVSDLIGEISSASGEQSTGIAQVGDAVAQLDQVTQQNAALVEESAAAAESLRQQADALASMVNAFQLRNGQAGIPDPARTRSDTGMITTIADRRASAARQTQSAIARAAGRDKGATDGSATTGQGGHPAVAHANDDWTAF